MVSLFGWGSSPASDASKTTQEKPAPEQSQPPAKEPLPPLPYQTPRPPLESNTNLKLLFGGMTFFALSVLVTRRAFHKKRIACIPPFYTSSLYHQPHSNSAMDAFEALNLATLNVISFGLMAGGAAGYALNINSLEDMRIFVRAGLQGGSDTPVKSDEELEQEVTEWVTKVLGDKFEKQLEKEKMKRAFQQAKTDQDTKDN
ncbi:uncharacterized protein N7529_006532 [Penicillium soppii]|jgi:hypothetical protein|uniref:uncharacterized protein n=1 Tax=Penicillium soppii TaxID=69789 RepID=UPI002549B57A|nr:uncharacterized protein N7529_006532 [Penicillium soppii]KAJ5864616.1 hypothetical protein N7529_006532 [Penicillium soppii]